MIPHQRRRLTPRMPLNPDPRRRTQQTPIPTRRYVGTRKEGWPPGHPDDHPKNAPASADKPSPRDSSGLSVTPGAGSPRLRRRRADASLYEPVPGRSWWWLSIRCPWCSGTHLGRVRQEDQAGGPRRLSCGAVWVVVRRTYRRKAGPGRAA